MAYSPKSDKSGDSPLKTFAFSPTAQTSPPILKESDTVINLKSVVEGLEK
jgi:hypothetical protein